MDITITFRKIIYTVQKLLRRQKKNLCLQNNILLHFTGSIRGGVIVAEEAKTKNVQ